MCTETAACLACDDVFGNIGKFRLGVIASESNVLLCLFTPFGGDFSTYFNNLDNFLVFADKSNSVDLQVADIHLICTVSNIIICNGIRNKHFGKKILVECETALCVGEVKDSAVKHTALDKHTCVTDKVKHFLVGNGRRNHKLLIICAEAVTLVDIQLEGNLTALFLDFLKECHSILALCEGVDNHGYYFIVVLMCIKAVLALLDSVHGVL